MRFLGILFLGFTFAHCASAPSKKPWASGDGLTLEDVTTVIQSHLKEVSRCYENRTSFTGILKFDFIILPGGTTDSVTYRGPDNGKELAECVKSNLETWVFPKPTGGIKVTVSYPFSFKHK